MSRRLMRDGVRWEIDGLGDEDADALFAWVAGEQGVGEIIKETRVRRVIRFPGRLGDLYLKHHRVHGFLDRLRFLALPSRARAEWEMARKLSALKIPTIRPLALGERRHLGLIVESFLVTEGISGARSLDVLLEERDTPPPGPPRARWRRALVRALAGVVSAFHREGFYHRDLHLGNFLVRSYDSADVAVWLIDLHKARASRARTWVTDLAWLDYGARPRASGTDRLRFLKAYLQGMPRERLGDAPGASKRAPWKRVARRVLAASNERADAHRARRAKRSLRGGPHFAREATPLGLLHRAEDADREGILAALRLSADGSGGDTLRDTLRARVVRVRLEDGRTLCVKRYRRSRWAFHARDRARAAWRAAEGSRLRGIATPRALGLLERAGGGSDSVFVMEDLGHLPWLTHYAALTLRRPGVPPARRRAHAEAVGVWLRHLHAAGLRHADLKAGNILVDEAGEGWRFPLLDLEDVDFPGKVMPADRERALAQLCGSLPPQVSRTDRLRAFRAYARGGTFGDARETRDALARVVRQSIARKHLWGPGARKWEPEPEGYGRSPGAGSPPLGRT